MYLEPKEKVILVFFPCPYTSSQTQELRKKYERTQSKKVKSKRHETLDSLFEFSEYDYIFVIIINTLFYADLEVTSKII